MDEILLKLTNIATTAKKEDADDMWVIGQSNMHVIHCKHSL